MKKSSFRILILMALVIPSTLMESRGQGASLQGFSVKASPGALTYYGDLSTNNLNVFKRIGTGSKFGIGGSIIKQFSPFFGMQAQFVAGSLYTSAPDNTYFAGALNEFSLSARFDPIRLWKGRSFRLSPYVSVGVGTFSFRSVHREMGTNLVLLPSFGYDVDGVTNVRKQTAMSMPMAIGLSYKILPYLQLELEHSLRMTNTDLLDCVKGSGTANDLYSLTSIGFRFTIPSKPGRELNLTNTLESPVSGDKTPAREIKIKDASLSYPFIECTMPENAANGQTIDVTFRINKGAYTGPAQIIQKFPEGFTPEGTPGAGMSFSFTYPNLIIEWDKMPDDTVVWYQYRMKISERVTGSRSINGKFIYDEPGGSKTIRFNKSIFIDTNQNAADIEIAANQAVKPEDSRKTEGVAQGSRGNIRKSEPKAGIEFRVQIGAFRENSQAEKELATKHKVTEVIQEEFTDGWYKYTVGSFQTYEEAVRYRDSFIDRTRILSAFIVAYKDGRRLANITEAFK